MCPDSVLLVAYLDGTLFPRDTMAVNHHLLSCERCTTLLASMRQERAAAAKRSRPWWAIPAAIIVVAVAGVGAWTLWPRPEDAPPIREPTPIRSDVAPAPAAPSVAVTPAPVEPPVLVARATPKPALDVPKPKVVPLARTAKPLIQWRTHDLVVERSIDGGATWATEQTADRPIRAAAFVSADVAWVVGENGLILRRTKNGWFGATPPGEGHLIAVRASSPSKATVTFEDGRVFTTANGGVTWSTP